MAEQKKAGPYGPDIVEIRLGMTFDEAERLIRANMKVERVLDGKRASDEAKAGFDGPLDSGKLFIGEGGGELIAIFDEPPAAPGRVLVAWRRVYIPSETVAPTEVLSRIQQKYGPPSGGGQMRTGSPSFWYGLAGGSCLGLYNTAQARPLDSVWVENGAPAAIASPNGAKPKSPYLPHAFLDPLAPGNRQPSDCGPFLTATLLLARDAGGQVHELDMTLTDLEPYVVAYAGRRKLQQAAGTVPAGDATPVYTGPYGPVMAGVQLGMSFTEAERAIREHMKVGHVLEPPPGAQAETSGKLFVSADGSELMAILDEPQGAQGVVTASWRQIWAPPSATLEFVATRMKDKYGDPAFRSNEGDLLFWGKPQNSPRCTFAYASATHAQSPIVATWLEKGAPTAWRPANGDKEPNAPGLPAKPAPNNGTSVEDCGPYVTMRFLPAQGYPPMNVIETTLTDMARQEKARIAGARAQKPASAAPIKF